MERSLDSCNPMSNLTLKSFRIYSIVFPVIIFILILEGIFVFMAIPDTLGSAVTVKGKLPALPAGIKLHG